MAVYHHAFRQDRPKDEQEENRKTKAEAPEDPNQGIHGTICQGCCKGITHIISG